MSDAEQVPVSVCRSCGKPNDQRTLMGEIEFKKAVKPGHVSICFTCGHIAVFAEDMTLREPTNDEMHDIAGQKEVIRIQKARAEFWREQKFWEEYGKGRKK